MTNLANVTSRVRLELQDQPEPFRSTVSADGESYWYDLPKQQIVPDTVSVQDSSGTTLTNLAEGTDYIVDYTLGQFQLANPPAYQDELIVSGQSWRMFSDDELAVYITDAFNQHTYGSTFTERFRNRYGFITYRNIPKAMSNLPAIEEPLVTMLSVINVLWALANDLSTDADVQTAEGTNIQRSAIYRQIRAQIDAMTERYKDWCGQLNVGLFRIEVLKQRRVSQRTGRLVPLFEPREYDDHRFPTRMLPPIDKQYEDNSGVPSPLWQGYGW